MRYLDPKNDLTFKKVFGEHPHLLKSFLNALLPLEKGRVVESLEYLPAELVPEVPFFKHSIVDVRCQDNYGRQFIVEMQMLWTEAFRTRMVFNASKTFVRQIGKAGEYRALQPVYALSLVNAIFEPGSPNFYHHYRLIHTTEPERHLEGLELIFVELPKFRTASLLGQRMQVLWLRYLTEIEDQTEQIAPELLAEPVLEEAVEYLREGAFSRAQLEGYDKYWDSIRSEQALLSAALTDGKTEGKAEGLAEGKAEGLAEGLAQGAAEQTRKLARQMLATGLNAPTVQQITGLSADDLAALRT